MAKFRSAPRGIGDGTRGSPARDGAEGGRAAPPFRHPCGRSAPDRGRAPAGTQPSVWGRAAGTEPGRARGSGSAEPAAAGSRA